MLMKPILTQLTDLGLSDLIINFCGITIILKFIPQYYQILCEANIFLGDFET